MSVLEVLLRGVAAGAMLATSAGMLGADRNNAARWAGALFCWSVAAFAVHSGGPETEAVSALAPLVWFLSAGGAGYFWMFAASLFQDRRFGWDRVLPAAVLTAVAGVAMALPAESHRGAWVVHNLLEIGLAAHVVLLVWQSWDADLVESRRSLRAPFIAAVALFSVALSGLEVADYVGVSMAKASGIQAATLALATVLGAFVFLQAKPALFESATATGRRAETDDMPARDRVLLAKLEEMMRAEEVWRREGLTIAQLASEVGTQEHRLRRLINARLGYRNFADFLNSRRISAAKTALSDPGLAQDSISTIAFRLGYSSLGPFNRAFKASTGMTPSAWRKSALSPKP